MKPTKPSSAKSRDKILGGTTFCMYIIYSRDSAVPTLTEDIVGW